MAKQSVWFTLEITDYSPESVKNPSKAIAEILDNVKSVVLKNNEPKQGKVRDKKGNVLAQWRQTSKFENESES